MEMDEFSKLAEKELFRPTSIEESERLAGTFYGQALDLDKTKGNRLVVIRCATFAHGFYQKIEDLEGMRKCRELIEINTLDVKENMQAGVYRTEKYLSSGVRVRVSILESLVRV